MKDLNDLDKVEELCPVEEGFCEFECREEKQKKHSKLTSAKLWVTIWAVAMVSYIVLANRVAFTTIAQWLCGVPLAYIGANVYQKKIFADKNGGN